MEQGVIEVRSGREAGVRFTLTEASATIGRDPVHDWLLTDPRVSREHARVFQDGGLLLIQDLDSSAGTKVNGTTITRAEPLRRGDVLLLGATELVVIDVPVPHPTLEIPLPTQFLQGVAAAAPPPPGPAAPPPPAPSAPEVLPIAPAPAAQSVGPAAHDAPEQEPDGPDGPGEPVPQPSVEPEVDAGLPLETKIPAAAEDAYATFARPAVPPPADEQQEPDAPEEPDPIR